MVSRSKATETGAEMEIQVNGEQRSMAYSMTIADLLKELALNREQVAVEVNLRIVDREEFARHRLQEGDRIEIMSFIGGGAAKLV